MVNITRGHWVNNNIHKRLPTREEARNYWWPTLQCSSRECARGVARATPIFQVLFHKTPSPKALQTHKSSNPFSPEAQALKPLSPQSPQSFKPSSPKTKRPSSSQVLNPHKPSSPKEKSQHPQSPTALKSTSPQNLKPPSSKALKLQNPKTLHWLNQLEIPNALPVLLRCCCCVQIKRCCTSDIEAISPFFLNYRDLVIIADELMI